MDNMFLKIYYHFYFTVFFEESKNFLLAYMHGKHSVVGTELKALHTSSHQILPTVI